MVGGCVESVDALAVSRLLGGVAYWWRFRLARWRRSVAEEG